MHETTKQKVLEEKKIERGTVFRQDWRCTTHSTETFSGVHPDELGSRDDPPSTSTKSFVLVSNPLLGEEEASSISSLRILSRKRHPRVSSH